MAPTILSLTVASIATIKLEQLSRQQSSFENGKAELLKAVNNEPNQLKKVEILLDRVEGLASMSKLADNPLLSLDNLKLFVEQAAWDPSVSTEMHKNWHVKIEKELDFHSLRYEYASLYGKLATECLSASRGDDMPFLISFDEIPSHEAKEQRLKWENFVFTAHETDKVAIRSYLDELFSATKAAKVAYENLCKATTRFEAALRKEVHFDAESLSLVIHGLRRSDLLTDEKKKVLKDFLADKDVLSELCDVLNTRMSTLEEWQWDTGAKGADLGGTSVEQRRQISGRYRFFQDEDLLHAMLLRYIGSKWSVHFKAELKKFQKTPGVWKPSSAPVPQSDLKRREHFLGRLVAQPERTVESQRAEYYSKNIFLDQLQERMDEKRGSYDDDSEEAADTRKSAHQITQGLLHVLASEIVMNTSLGREGVVVRTDFEAWGPSLAHSTIFAVLGFFNISEKWLDFFRRALEVPLVFLEDGFNAKIRVRKRGTPVSSPLSDFFGESVLFCLDFAVNQRTDGVRLYRLHDDIWFWGGEAACVKGWAVMNEFTKMMGQSLNKEKTGSIRITKDKNAKPLPFMLPKGDVRWGFLKLDSTTGRFLIDQAMVDVHTEKLRRQLAACKSVFDWIQVWNIYGARFFTSNFGTPAQSFGREHVNSMIGIFHQIQTKIFASTGGSVTSTLKQMITDRFGVKTIPEGYLYFPTSMGGLDVKNPLANLYQIRRNTEPLPSMIMDRFFQREKNEYEAAKLRFESGKVPGGKAWSEYAGETFMSFEEFTKHREQTSIELLTAYEQLIMKPEEHQVKMTTDVSSVLGCKGWEELLPYQQWIVQLYASDMIARFGGLTNIEEGLLPTGLVNMFRESRFKWEE